MFRDIKNYIASTDKPTLLFAIASAWPIMGFLPSLPDIISYGISIVFAIYCIRYARTLDKAFLLLLLYIPIELLIAQPNRVFHSWQRYVYFAILLINVSPFMQSYELRQHREQIFQIMMWACVLIGVGSFFARMLGINYMRGYNIDALSTAGIFGGLTTHSMMLGPIAGVAACYLSSRAMTTRRFLDWVWVVLAIFSVLFSSSRAALLASIVGVVITVFCKSGSSSRFLRVAIVALVIASSTYTFWEGALSGVLEKNGSSSSLNLDSRETLWKERINDFKSSPIFGVGFCAASISESSIIDMESGRIESGTSWIIIFSMLGVLGAIMIIPIFFKAFRTAYRRKDDGPCPVICGVLSLFFVHMFAEGYIFAGGSFLAFMLWLTVGVAMDSRFIDE